MTPKKIPEAFSFEGASAWKLLLVVGLIVSATLNAVSTIKGMTRTDEILAAIAELRQQMKNTVDQAVDNRQRVNAVEKDVQNARERLAGLEGAKGPGVRASSVVP